MSKNKIKQMLKPFLKPGYTKIKKILLQIYCYTFVIRNKYSHKMLTNGKKLVVSLTTHGERYNTVYLTIESIMAGQLLPDRLILWVDDENLYNNIPNELVRLKKRGLEIQLTKNLGPHTKYYPYIENENLDVKLVTADDDILYSKSWLSKLYEASNKHPNFIVCHRAHRIAFHADGKLKDYDDWASCKSSEPSVLNFATGVSGVLYPPFFNKLLLSEKKGFLDKCPKADDIWLHWVAYKNNIKIKQLTNKAKMFPIIPNTQDKALLHSNVGNNGNDEQIRKTYNFKELNLLSKKI